jgi:hypothetical protein
LIEQQAKVSPLFVQSVEHSVMDTVGVAAQSGLSFLRQYQQERPFDLADDRFVRLHEWFLQELSTIDGLADHLNDGERANYRATCSLCHKRYLAIKEAQANKNLLAIASKAQMLTGENLRGRDRNAYDRVRDLRQLIDFRSCENVAMVGSGAFPSTLLWLRDNFPMLHYVGLDLDPGCVKMATELVVALGINNVHFELIDGRQYDFGGFDFVYVANHVVPKRAVLEQIASTTSARQVVVREPTPVGELLADAVRPDLPPVFVVDAAGAASGQFLSYDLLLHRL